jgi:hypothetical protein
MTKNTNHSYNVVTYKTVHNLGLYGYDVYNNFCFCCCVKDKYTYGERCKMMNCFVRTFFNGFDCVWIFGIPVRCPWLCCRRKVAKVAIVRKNNLSET